MTQDPDSLAQALYDTAQRLLKHRPDVAPWRPAIDFQLRLDERTTLTAILEDVPGLVARRPCQILIADKNYYGRDFECSPAQTGLHGPERSAAALTHGERGRLFAMVPVLEEHYRGNGESGFQEEPAAKMISQISPTAG